jgi:hypothetical protein
MGLQVQNIDCMLPKSPAVNSKEFSLTILSEANFRMDKNSFQRAKGDLGNKPLRPERHSFPNPF